MENSIIKLNQTEREGVLAALKTDTARAAVQKCYRAETEAISKADNAVKKWALTVDEMVQNRVFELEGMSQSEFAETVGISSGRVSQCVGACRFLRKDAEAGDKLLADKFSLDALYQLSSVPIGTINDALAKGEIRYGMGPVAIKEWKKSLILTDGKEAKVKPVKVYDVSVHVVRYGYTNFDSPLDKNGEMIDDAPLIGARVKPTVEEEFYHNMPIEAFDSEIQAFQSLSCGEGVKVPSGLNGIKALFYPSVDGTGHILVEYTEPIKPVKPKKPSAKDVEIAKLRAALEAAGIKV